MNTLDTITNKLVETTNHIDILESSVFLTTAVYCSKCYRHAIVGRTDGTTHSSCCNAEIETGKAMLRRSIVILDELEKLKARLESLVSRYDTEAALATYRSEVEALCRQPQGSRRMLTPVVATAFYPDDEKPPMKNIISTAISPDIGIIDVMGNRSIPSGTYSVVSGPYPTRTCAKKLADSSLVQAVTKVARKKYYIIQLIIGEEK